MSVPVCPYNKSGKHRTAKAFMECPACGPKVSKTGPSMLISPPLSSGLSARTAGADRHSPLQKAMSYFRNMSAQEAFDAMVSDRSLPSRTPSLVALSEYASPALLEMMWDHYSGDNSVRCSIAGNPNISEDLMMKILDNDEGALEAVVDELIHNPSASHRVLNRIVDGGDLELISQVCERSGGAPRGTAKVIASKFRNGELSIVHIHQMAKHKETPTESLSVLVEPSCARGDYADIRTALAAHKNLDAESLQRLFDFSISRNVGEGDTLSSIAGRRDGTVTPEMLTRLSQVPNVYVLYPVITNPDTPTEALATHADVGNMKEHSAEYLKVRVAERFGFDDDNGAAIDHVLGIDRWWELDDDDSAIFIARTMFGNREV